MTTKRLNKVSIFSEKLTFLIPNEWVEVESDENDVHEYQLPNATSGFFRVSLITADGSAEKLKGTFEKEFGNVEVNPTTGNLVARSEKSAVQDEVQIHIYYWFVAGCVAANVIREAVFSYTVLASLLDETETRSDVEIIGQLVANAHFGGPE